MELLEAGMAIGSVPLPKSGEVDLCGDWDVGGPSELEELELVAVQTWISTAALLLLAVFQSPGSPLTSTKLNLPSVKKKGGVS